MNSVNRVAKSISRTIVNPIPSISSISLRISRTRFDFISAKPQNGDDEWNDAWESAWSPDDLTEKNRAPWETDVNFPSTAAGSTAVIASEEVDVETRAFVEDLNEHWIEWRGVTAKSGRKEEEARNENGGGESLYSLESMKKDYRLKKQRIHAALWVKETEEAKLRDSGIGGGDDINGWPHDKKISFKAKEDVAREILEETKQTQQSERRDPPVWFPPILTYITGLSLPSCSFFLHLGGQ